MRIIGFDGSLFAESTTARILSVALSGAHAYGADTEVVILREMVREPFNGMWDDAAALSPSMHSLMRTMKAADGFIFATPTWWSMPSDPMKIFLSSLTCGDLFDFPLDGKAAGIIAVCEEDGAQHAAMMLSNALTHMGCAIAPCAGSFFYNKNMIGKSEENWQETDQKLVGRNVARLAALLASDEGGWL